MPTRISTGLANKLLVTGSLRATFAACFIDIYSGVQPASADDAASGTKLATIFSDGAAVGLNLHTVATDGVVPKAPAETWSTNSIIASGQAGWFRMREAADPGTGASTTAARLDGSVGTTGAQLNLSSVNLTQGAPLIISTANFTLPKAA